MSFKLSPELIAAAPGAQGGLQAGIAPAPEDATDAAARVAAQEDAIFVASRALGLERQWQELAQAQWRDFDADAEAVGDSYAGAMAAAIDESLAEAAEGAPSVAAARGLEREIGGLAETGKRHALLRERGARVDGARRFVAQRFAALQDEAGRAPERLPELMAQSDRLIGEHRELLAADAGADLRIAAHETLARRAIAGAIAADPESAAGRLPGRAVLAREEIAAWDAVARAMAASRSEGDRAEWHRRFENDLKSVRDTGEPGFELADWIVEASGGAAGRLGPRQESVRALADQLLLARAAARTAHRGFMAEKFTDWSAALKAADASPQEEPHGGSDTDGPGIDDDAYWAAARDPQRHLERLRAEHVARLRADPAAVAFEHAPVRRAWEAGDVEAALAQGLALQRRMGIDRPRPLPAAEADRLAAHLAQLAAPELAQALMALRAAGNDHLPALLAQLGEAGLPPALALAGVLPGDAARAALVNAREDGTAPSMPDPELAAAARAGLAETALGRHLHEGAARSGRDDPAWERAYRDAEAVAVRVGSVLARTEGEAGAARAARLLFGALDGDRRALGRAVEALGAPTHLPGASTMRRLSP